MAYARIYVPDTLASGRDQSSYFRLGAYTSDESALVTGLTTTKSENATADIDPEDEADALHDGKGVKSKTKNEEMSVSSSVKSTHTTDNKGLLAFTKNDLQVHAKGAALMKFGNGHTTDVSDGDAKYTVPKGRLDISAKNGIKLSAGVKDSAPANLELYASYYIKQTADGPVSEITYGHSEKRTIGTASDFFLGAKFTCMIGSEMKLNMLLAMSTFIGISLTFKLAYEFSLAAVGSSSIRFLTNNTLSIGAKADLIQGADFKQVTGTSTKIVVGPDVKVATSDLKVLTTWDTKFCTAGDMKRVGVNFTDCTMDIKRCEVSVDSKNMAAHAEMLAAHMDQIKSSSGNLEAKTKASVMVL